MPFNLLKKYNDLLEVNHLTELQKTVTLRGIFQRDIENNAGFLFRNKPIRPIKNKEGIPAMDTLFDHLTKTSSEEKNKEGKKIKTRKQWDNDRCIRLHWIRHHIEECTPNCLIVFSCIERVKGKGNVERTYLYDTSEQYVVILEPYRKTEDYYLLTAFHLTKEKGGIKQIKTKLKNKLDAIL